MDPRKLLVLTAACLLTTSLAAQLSFDNFDSYAAGSTIAGQGDWDTWDQNPAVDAEVSTLFAQSQPNSLQLQAFDDIVRLFNGFNTGNFTFRSSVYIPSGQNGEYFFILLNTYNHGGPYNWSAQIEISDATGMVQDVGGSSAPTGTSTPTTVVYDQWVDVRVEVDLTNNTYDAFYGQNMIMQGNAWFGAGGQSSLQCLDLYNNGGGVFYYDNVSVDCQGGCAGCLPFDAMTCDIDCVTNDVTMDWTTFQIGGYANGISIVRNGTTIATLPGTATSYSDLNAPLGLNSYEVIGDCGGGQTWSATCEVACTGACPPAMPADECCDAVPAVLGANPFDNTGMSESPDPYSDALCTGVFLGDMIGDVWFSYTSATTGFLRFDTCNTMDTDLVIYEGSDCGTKVQIACSGDECGLSSDVTIPTTAGTEYLIRVGLWCPAVGAAPADLMITELCEPAFTGMTSLIDCVTGDVTLNWAPLTFDSFDVVRDGVTIASGLPSGTSSYVDLAVPGGNYVYDVVASCASGSSLTDTLALTVSAQLGVTDIILRGEDQFGGDVDSAVALENALIANGLSPAILDGGPEDLACADDPLLERVWVMMGTFPANRLLTTQDAAQLIVLQSLGKHIYFESGDEWGFGVVTAFNDIDGIEAMIDDGNDTFLSMTGADSGLGLDTSDLVGVPYAQDQAGNDWTDQLVPSSTDLLGPDTAVIWSEAAATYDTGVFYSTNAGGRLICVSWEFGGFGLDPMNPGASDAMRTDLAMRYINAFSGGPPPPTEQFIRGDCNADGGINIADAIFGLGALFPPPGGTPNMPSCADSCDANDDGSVNIADMISILSALFPQPGMPPAAIPAPNPSCGPDPTMDPIDCATNTAGC